MTGDHATLAGEVCVRDAENRLLWGRIPRPRDPEGRLALGSMGCAVAMSIYDAAKAAMESQTREDADHLCALIEGAAGAMRGEAK